METAAGQRPSTRIPQQQEISIEIHPQHQVVEFKGRDHLAIQAHSVFVPFALLEVTFHSVLGLRVAQTLAHLSPGGSPDRPADVLDVPPRSTNGTTSP